MYFASKLALFHYIFALLVKYCTQLSQVQSWTKIKQIKSTICQKQHFLNFPLSPKILSLPKYNVVHSPSISTSTVFPTLIWGKGDWEQETENYIVYIQVNCCYLIYGYGRNRLIQTWNILSHTIYFQFCQGLAKMLLVFKKLIFVFLFLSWTVE